MGTSFLSFFWRKMNKNITIFAIILSALMALDVITTKSAIGDSLGREGNPFMAMLVNDTALFLLVKAVGTIAIIYGLNWVYMRNKAYSRIGQWIIVAMMVIVVANNLFVISAKAETGNIQIINNSLQAYNVGNVNTLSTPDFTTMEIDSADYNQIEQIYLNLSGQSPVFSTNGKSTTFTCTSGCTGGGLVSYSKASTSIAWYFSNPTTVTANPIVLSYSQNILADLTGEGGPCAGGFCGENAGYTVSLAQPVIIHTSTGRRFSGNYSVVVDSNVVNHFDISYQAGTNQLFTTTITKVGYTTVNTKVLIQNASGTPVLYPVQGDSTFNNGNWNVVNTYGQGITLNMSVSSGLYALLNVNLSGSTLAPPVTVVGTGGSTGDQLRYNYTTATRGSSYGFVANITASNFSSFNEYALYAYDFNNNLVTGFPIKFYSRNYSTLNMWTFAHAGSYLTNLTSCDVVCRASMGLIQPSVIDTATIDISDVPGTYAITTDRTTYLPGQNIIVTVTRPAGVPVWITALDNINYSTFPEIAFNLPFTNGVNTQTIILPSNIPYGNYSFFMFLNSDGTNQVAATQFNIGITSGTLSVIWSAKEQVTGTYATVKASTALNYSTLQITNPYGVVNSFNISPNTVNITSVYLNSEGYWNANITDNGNTSNISTSTLHANTLTTNETFTQCTSKYIYVCWDKQVYLQGEPYTITYKFPISAWNIGETVWLFVFNPNSVEVVDYYANSTFNILAGQWVGSIHGTFSPTATIGVYTANIINKGSSGNTTKATAQARVDPSTSTTPATSTQQTSVALLAGTLFAALLVLIMFVTIGNEIGGVVGAIVGFGGGFILLSVFNMVPLWSLYLFAILIITVFSIIVGSIIIGSGKD